MTKDNWRAVNSISCRIRENERMMFCGGWDSGKEVLMHLIAGMDKPCLGEVWVMNQAVHEMDKDKAAVFRNRYIGLVQRAAGFLERLSVAENVALPLIIRGVSWSQQRKTADDLLKRLGIWHLAQALPAQLTAYEARVACIARALITKPKILLLNEVTSRLSQRDADKITETIRIIADDGDHTVLYFSDRNSSFDTDRTIYLENGKIRRT
jgi:ABC-type lipoprotein export system ATPase subunit